MEWLPRILDGLAPALPQLGIGVALLGSGVWLGRRWAHARRVRLMARARESGAAGERRGLRILRRAGYRIEQQQASSSVLLRVDGVLREFDVRADALVCRKNRRYVAEFKGGVHNAGVHHRGTRRQLFEYAHAYAVDGVLLVDGRNGTIERVEFEVDPRH